MAPVGLGGSALSFSRATVVLFMISMARLAAANESVHEQLATVGTTQIEAEQLIADPGLSLYQAIGHAHLKHGNLNVSADRLVFDARLGVLTAQGRVVIIDHDAILMCRRATLYVPSLRGEFEDAEFSVARATTSTATSRATVRGRFRYGERRSDQTIHVEGVSLTPCQCDANEAPEWSLSAVRAQIDIESGAWLVAPILHIKDIPVFALPVAYVPFGGRRSGVLLPRASYTEPAGVDATLPVYWAIHDSWDLTLDARYMSRRGPAPSIEARYAPTASTQGTITSMVLLDFGDLDGGRFAKTRPRVLPRGALSARHRTQQSASTWGVELNLTTDPALVSEFGSHFLDRQAELLLSRATYAWRADSAVNVTLGVAFAEDLRARKYQLSSTDPFVDELREQTIWTTDATGAGLVRQRLLDLRLDAIPRPFGKDLANLYFGARVGVQGFAAPNPDVPRFVRVDMRPALDGHWTLANALLWEPSFALRLVGSNGADRADQTTAGKVALTLKNTVSTEVVGSLFGLTHRIRPELSHFIIPFVFGETPTSIFIGDEIDTISVVHQAEARIITDLWVRGRPAVELLASVGRDFAFRDSAGKGTEYFAIRSTGHAQLGDVELSLSARGTFLVDPLSMGSLDVQASAAFTSRLHVEASGIFSGSRLGPDFFLAPDELHPSSAISRAGFVEWPSGAPFFAPDSDTLAWSKASAVDVRIGYRPIDPLSIQAGVSLDPFADAISMVRMVHGQMAWRSPCKCWSAALAVSKSRDRDFPDILPDIQLILDFQGLDADANGYRSEVR